MKAHGISAAYAARLLKSDQKQLRLIQMNIVTGKPRDVVA